MINNWLSIVSTLKDATCRTFEFTLHTTPYTLDWLAFQDCQNKIPVRRNHDFLMLFGPNLQKGNFIFRHETSHVRIGNVHQLPNKFGLCRVLTTRGGHGRSTLHQNISLLVENQDGLDALVRRQATHSLLQFHHVGIFLPLLLLLLLLRRRTRHDCFESILYSIKLLLLIIAAHCDFHSQVSRCSSRALLGRPRQSRRICLH
jgi:hypothetical protein